MRVHYGKRVHNMAPLELRAGLGGATKLLLFIYLFNLRIIQWTLIALSSMLPSRTESLSDKVSSSCHPATSEQ